MKTLLFEESPHLVVAITILFALIDKFLQSYKFISFKHRILILCFYIFLILFLMFFYRLPQRTNTIPKNYIVSPCDGKIVSILNLNNNQTHICIYLNIFDAHIQWIPTHGVITKQIYRLGTFNPAYFLEKSKFNERMETTLFSPLIRDNITIVQIAGQVARRIVNYTQKGDYVTKGDLLGMIKLSSRVDIFVPTDKINLFINVGDKVIGNKTIIGKFQ